MRALRLVRGPSLEAYLPTKETVNVWKLKVDNKTTSGFRDPECPRNLNIYETWEAFGDGCTG